MLVERTFMEDVVLFLLTFLFVLFIYRVFIAIPKKRKKKKKKKYKDPVEVVYLVNKYKLDLKRVKYNQLLWVVSIVSSFDIALIVTVIVSIKNFILEIVVGFVFMIAIIVVSYHLVYLFYKKKGMISNG